MKFYNDFMEHPAWRLNLKKHFIALLFIHKPQLPINSETSWLFLL